MSHSPRHILLRAYAILVCFSVCGLLLLAAYSEHWSSGHFTIASSTGASRQDANLSVAVKEQSIATSSTAQPSAAATLLSVANQSASPFVEMGARDSLNQSVGVASPVDMRLILRSLAEVSYHRLTHQFSRGATLECGNTPFLAVVVVQCLPRHSLRRATIRQTWATEARSAGFKVIFFLGRECADNPTDVERDADAKAAEALSAEASEHGDLLIADFCEHYLNLTLKTLLMIEWASGHCSAASYLVKIDSDVYLHAERLRELLLLPSTTLQPTSATTVAETLEGGDSVVQAVARHLRREIIGHLSDQHVPSRSELSKWYMPYDLFNGTYYPPFVYGPCYVLSVDLLADLAAACKRISYLPYEDVFVTGMCSEHLSAVNRRGYATFIENHCWSNDAVAVHWYSCWKNQPVEFRVLFASETA